MAIPVLVKLISSLMFIILLNKLTGRLPLSLFGGTLLFAFWVGFSVSEIITTTYLRLFSLETAGLLLLVALVILLSLQMKATGVIEELVLSIRGTFSSRDSLAILPAVIGLLPMPGGALFSAPLLDGFDDLPSLAQEKKTLINYWFRHVWEYAWPLYPGIIVACSVAGIELYQILLLGLPISVAAILFGYWFFLRGIGNETRPVARGRLMLGPFIPVMTVILTYLMIQLLFPAVSSFNRYLPMIIGLSLALLVLNRRRPLDLPTWWSLVTAKNIYKMLLIILMVRIYGAFIEADLEGLSVVAHMARELGSAGIPTLPLIMAVPFLAGLTMGVSVGFAGAAIPVVVALLGSSPSFGTLAGSILFAYACGFMGTMLSPLHVCMIVTCEYYRTDLNRSFRAIIPPAIGIMAFTFLYMQILILLFPA